MKKSIIFLTTGLLMLISAIIFIWHALNHPEQSWSIPLIIVYILYVLYFIANITCFVLFGIFRQKEKIKK